MILAVVGPEVLAVEGEGPSAEGDGGDVGSGLGGGIDPGEEVLVGFLGVGGGQVDLVVDNRLAAYPVWGVDGPDYLIVFSESQDLFVVPLADVEVGPVEAELGSGIVRAGKFEYGVESAVGDKPADDSVVLFGLAAEDAKLVADGDHAEGDAGRFHFPEDGPGFRVDLIDGFGVHGSHPQVVVVPGEALGPRDWRGEAFDFLNSVHLFSPTNVTNLHE